MEKTSARVAGDMPAMILPNSTMFVPGFKVVASVTFFAETATIAERRRDAYDFGL
jgi:hypothetical protein